MIGGTLAAILEAAGLRVALVESSETSPGRTAGRPDRESQPVFRRGGLQTGQS
ncbi:MAG: hypothetical protein M3436_14080 [Pseudomonadota bacterium]|nr:hypothetical protein [Pseudomonadota bacterium]